MGHRKSSAAMLIVYERNFYSVELCDYFMPGPKMHYVH